MKVDITLHKQRNYSKKCMCCERTMGDEYYNIDINYIIDNTDYGRYKQLCLECHCSLKKHFTGVD